MQSFLLQDDDEVQSILDLIERVPGESTLDIEELMQLQQVKSNTRLWRDHGRVMGFALVDHFNNLRFTLDPACREYRLEDEIVQWGTACVSKHNFETGDTASLDVCLDENETWRIALLERHGFMAEGVRTLRYARSLREPIVDHAVPSGFSLRCARGEEEVEALVELHRAAFGTAHMTVEERLAIMRTPQYERELDLLAITPNDVLAAFCICGLKDIAGRIGYTDPIGVRPYFQNMGLGKAIVTAGLRKLKVRGAEVVELGTSSDNIGMQKLAESLGFAIASERLWYTKEVD